MFKKFTFAIVCIAILLSFIACSKDNAHQNGGITNQTENSFVNDTSQTSNSTEEPNKPTEETSKPTEEPSKTTEETSKPTEEPSKTTEETSKPTEEIKAVFKTENIIRVTFYGYYGSGNGSDVPAENMTDIINWLSSFTIGEKAPDILPPGTNTYYVEIEYSDGTIIKSGLDARKIDEITYYLKRDKEPECFMDIISKISLS